MYFKKIISRRLLFLYLGSLLILLGSVVFLHGRPATAQNATLYWGSSGDDVYRLQQKLRQWGYYNGPADGYYGGDTLRAVQEFQRNNGLNDDGVVGRSTWEALGLSAPEAAPAVSRGAASDRGDVAMLAQVIEGEAANEPLIGKVGVGAVILNRTRSASFPHTICGVIFQDNAFESICNGQAYRPVSREAVQAAEMAMSGYDPTGGALFFWNPAKPVSPWIWSRNIITQIGNHVFAR
jgi:N-acetylmuramoyl-L-alanine amidase